MDKIKQLDFSGQDIFIGLDTHLKSWNVSIIVGGIPYKTFSQDPRAVVLKNIWRRIFPALTIIQLTRQVFVDLIFTENY